MTIKNRTLTKTYFERGDKPTETQFSDFIDSATWNLGNNTLSGTQSIEGNVDITGDQTIIGNQNFTGDQIINGNLTVNGVLTATFLSAEYIDIKHYEISGFEVKGDVVVDGDIEVTGDIEVMGSVDGRDISVDGVLLDATVSAVTSLSSNVDSQYTYLSGEIISVNSDVITVSSDVISLSSDVIDLTTDGISLSSDVIDLTTDVGSLSSDVIDLTTDVISLSSGVISLSATVGTYDSNIDYLSGSIDGNTSSINSNSFNIASNSINIASLGNDVINKVDLVTTNSFPTYLTETITNETSGYTATGTLTNATPLSSLVDSTLNMYVSTVELSSYTLEPSAVFGTNTLSAVGYPISATYTSSGDWTIDFTNYEVLSSGTKIYARHDVTYTTWTSRYGDTIEGDLVVTNNISADSLYLSNSSIYFESGAVISSNTDGNISFASSTSGESISITTVDTNVNTVSADLITTDTNVGTVSSDITYMGAASSTWVTTTQTVTSNSTNWDSVSSKIDQSGGTMSGDLIINASLSAEALNVFSTTTTLSGTSSTGEWLTLTVNGSPYAIPLYTYI